MGTVNDLLATARKEIGNTESPAKSNRTKYGKWFGLDGNPWCMMFIMWCFNQVGVKLPKRTASCGDLMRAAKEAGCWVTNGFQPGDVMIFDFPGGASTDHCGIVEIVLPDYGVQSIEGNTSSDDKGSQDNGGGVYRRKRPRKYIVGAVRPIFDTEMEDDDMDVARFKELYNEMRKDLQDNDCGSWSKEARDWAISTGLIVGGNTLPDGQPNYMWADNLTREQAVALFFRFAQMMGKA